MEKKIKLTAVDDYNFLNDRVGSKKGLSIELTW